jgi:tRNA(fMet)-specific endonuclease VapC
MGQVSKNLFSYSPKDIFIPSIVIYELEVGIAKSNDSKKRKEQLNLLLEQTIAKKRIIFSSFFLA